LVNVTTCDGLVVPAPVIGNATDPGSSLTEPAMPPTPVRTANAGSENSEADTVRLPLTTPFALGVKTTPVEQLAAGAKVVPQEFWVTLNGGALAIFKPVAVVFPTFEMVAIWAAVGSPRVDCVKLNWSGVMLIPELPLPIPVSRTWAAETPAVDVDTESAAVSCPAEEGVNESWTVQLLPFTNFVPQVLLLQLKLDTAGPVS
jgi:hypothetical protein